MIQPRSAQRTVAELFSDLAFPLMGCCSMGTRLAKKVLLIGWDSADWQVIDPLIEQGLMPTLAGLIDRGVIGNMSTLRPVLSPMLWNSIATGKRADKHGIHGFIEP